MEPNTLASHNAPGVGPERTGRLNPPPALHAERAEGATRSPDASVMTTTDTAPAAAPSNGHAHPAPTPKHLNGHSNGHANGHAGWSALTLQNMAGATYAPAHPSTASRPSSFYLRAGKRGLDLAGALVGLVIGAPIMLIAAMCIKLESRGPVLYKSKRVGRGGRPFTFFKLRSMVNDAHRHRHHLSHLNETDGPVFKIARDPRVTRIGRFLRTTSIDELPQLFNVLRGDMSLVGPRPPIAEEVAQYEPWQFRRLEVRPGLTCLWQISGRSRIGFQEWMRLDLEYIRKQSFGLDIKILIRTIPAVLSREGAY
jgi:lipopolysaccharide/colanic/teichoic acid biosynthesis glycosyltransferase